MSFRGPVLDSPCEILGQPSLRLRLSADRTQAFVAALLVDEAPDGAQTLISRGFQNLTHRNSDTEPEPVVPGEEMTVDVQMHGIGYRVAAGHRLVIQVASAYWPILWPAPEPVTLTLPPGVSALSLPVRGAAATSPRELPAPSSQAAELPVTHLREGALDRSIKIDLTTGEHAARFYIDGGVFGPVGRIRLDETGTELGDISDRIYRIKPDDPLSARATMVQESIFGRGDWAIRIETSSEMTATKEDFELRAEVKCWEGEELFHTVEWNHVIPRRCT